MAPIISPFEFDAAVFYGESIQVLCNVPKGDTPLNLTWYFRDRPLAKQDSVIITKLGDRSSLLAIPSTTEKNSGNYTCAVSNIVASTNHTATLNVQGTHTFVDSLFVCWFIFCYFPLQFLRTLSNSRLKSQFLPVNQYN